MITRRSMMAAGAGVLAAPAIHAAEASRVLRMIPHADLTALDPVWTSAYITRNHGYMVFDTLYGQDSAFRAQPQMVEGHVVEAGGLEWRLRLRDGLRFHDGTPVLARDCVASIRRWGRRDAFGQTLLAVTAELSAPDDRTIRFQLRRPCPWLPDALGKIGINMLPIMPERLALTDPFKQVTEMVGSGPFRFLADERVSGAHVAYARFEGYVPREGTPDWTTGPKRAQFDRIDWNVVPDGATAAAALMRGEVDWWEQPLFDLLPQLARNPKVRISTIDVTGNVGLMRFNALHPPFDNPALRRAIWPALDQADFMRAVAGEDERYWRSGVGYFAPETPMASPVELDRLTATRSVEAARAAVKAAGYAGQKVVVMSPGDYPRIAALSLVGADLLQRCGFAVELQEMDWGSVIQRRASKAAPGQGGWNVFFTTFNGVDMANPAGNPAMRGNGQEAWFGWPSAPRLETLRDEWLQAADVPAQQKIAADIQAQAFQDVPFVPLGQFFQPTAMASSLVDGMQGMTLFWNLRRA